VIAGRKDDLIGGEPIIFRRVVEIYKPDGLVAERAIRTLELYINAVDQVVVECVVGVDSLGR
jgi:hypothetical protein